MTTTNGFEKWLLGGTNDQSINQLPSVDELDQLLTSQLLTSTATSSCPVNNTPLPPFTGYTGNLSVNGISGHHYHAIADQYVLPNGVDDDFGAILGSPTVDDATDQGDSSTGSTESWQDLVSWMSLQDYGATSLPSTSQSYVANPFSDSNNNQSASDNNSFSVNYKNNVVCPNALPDYSANPQLSQMVSCHPQQQPIHQSQHNTTFSYMPTMQGCLQDRSWNLTYIPPRHAVSTTDSTGFMPAYSSTRPSPELQVNLLPAIATTSSISSPSRPNSRVASGINHRDGNGRKRPEHHCSVCNRGFINKSNVKVHMRTHTGEKPFKCEICDKLFRQKAHREKHYHIHRRVRRD